MPDAAPAARGVYQPRRPQASPLFRLVSDHLHRLQTVYDERFAREYGPWCSVVAQVAEKFLACGILDHGFARIRCDDCAHAYLLGFSCKCRHFCPSCHAKRLAIWTQWLDTTLLAPVPHRQVVLTIPKRLRAYGLYRRRLLGEIARVAARIVTAAIRTLTGERDLVVGIVACLQTHGSRANWHPHLHLLVTDGGFPTDGTFVSWPVHETARVTEAFRRAVLRLFLRLALFDEDQAAGMLTWPHAGFHVHTAVWVPEDDRAFATRLARYCARNPVALERLTSDRAAQAVTYRSDKSEGPTAGTETVDPLEFLARVLVHIPDKGHVTTRDYGWYANRPRGMRLKATPAAAGPPAIAPAPRLAPTEVARRWALLLQQIFEVDPLACPTCRGAMRVVAFMTQSSVIDQILTQLRTRAVPAPHPGARSPPSTRAPASRSPARAPRLAADAPSPG
ncbi:IS91 family transposase [Gemmatimonas sp.]|uniref:IS91 family transposase n=1 Tax=Gemmatimonas sp. TaxID=1962908 RepID=UPI003DA24AA2